MTGKVARLLLIALLAVALPSGAELSGEEGAVPGEARTLLPALDRPVDLPVEPARPELSDRETVAPRSDLSSASGPAGWPAAHGSLRAPVHPQGGPSRHLRLCVLLL